jgi:hypothetical protein
MNVVESNAARIACRRIRYAMMNVGKLGLVAP